MVKRAVNIDYLRQRLTYNPHTGIFIWLHKPETNVNNRCWNSRCAGKIAGNTMGTGYQCIGIDNVQYLAHRLAWAYVTGQWPDKHVDHINRIRTDNRFENLRLVSRANNSLNTTSLWGNKSGFRGVSFHKLCGLFQARISHNRKQYTLGYFKTAEEASEAYEAAKKKILDGGLL